MTKKMTSQVAAFRANPAEFLTDSWVVGTPHLELARVLNAALFYCRTLDTNRWTSRQVARLLDLLRVSDKDLCAELAMVSAIEAHIVETRSEERREAAEHIAKVAALPPGAPVSVFGRTGAIGTSRVSFPGRVFVTFPSRLMADETEWSPIADVEVL